MGKKRRSFSKEFKLEAVTLDNPKNSDEFLPLAHLQFNNFKLWVKGPFNGVSKKEMLAYLDGGNYRFNRRSLISNLFQYVLICVTNSNPITYNEIGLGPSLMNPIHGLSRLAHTSKPMHGLSV